MTESIFLSGISVADFKNMMATLIEQAITKNNQTNTHASREIKLALTRKEVSAMLGGVSTPTLIEWSKTGYLKSFNIGSKVRYKLADVEAFINNRSKAAA